MTYYVDVLAEVVREVGIKVIYECAQHVLLFGEIVHVLTNLKSS